MDTKYGLLIGFIIFILALLFVPSCIKMDNPVREEKEFSGEQSSEVLSENSSEVVSKKPMTFSIEITKDEFEEAVLKNDKKVLVDFYADWCGPCHALEPILDEVLTKHPEIVYHKVNVDMEETLSNRYRVQYLPTLVVFENGTEVNRSIGLISAEEVEELIK